AGTNVNPGLENNGLGVINGINYGTHDNLLNSGQGSRIALQSSGNNIGAITINNADVVGVSSTSTLTLNNVTAANGVQVASTSGAIQNGVGTSIVAPTLSLSALNGIGTAANPINYDTATVITATGTPGVLATAVTGTTGNTFVSATGPVQLGGMVNTIGFTCNSTSSNVCNPATTTTGTAVTQALAGNSSALGNITLSAGGAVTTGSTVSTNGGSIDIGNSSGNITLGNAVTAGSKGNVELTSAANLLVNAPVSSTAGEINAQAANNVVLGANVSTAGNVFVQAATQAITQSGGTVSGNGVVLTAGTTIGTAANTIQLNSSQLALQSAGSAYASEAGPTTVAGQTTANGNLYVATTNGNLTVGAVNLTPTIVNNAPGASLTGLNANGKGTIETQATGGDLSVNAAMTSGSGEINAKSTTGNVNLGANITTTGNAFVEGNQAVTYTAGTITAKGAVLSSDNGPIGAAGTGTVQTAVNTLGVNAAGDAFVNNAGAMTVAAESANNGNLSLSTTSGTITVGSVALTPAITGNAAGLTLSGVSANGSGDANLTANGAGSNILITQGVTSGSGAINATAANNITFNNGVMQTGTGPTGIVSLNATGGQIINNEAPTLAVVSGNTLDATAANGIGTAAAGPGAAGDLGTSVSNLDAVITGTGNAVIQNSGALNVAGSVGANTLNVGTTGALTVSGPVSASGGTVNLISGMNALGSSVLANNAGGVTLASDVTAGTLSINSSGLVQQTAGSLTDTTTRVDTTRFTTGNSATLSNNASPLTEAGSTVAGNYTIATQGTLNQTGTTTVGGNLTETGQTGGTVTGTVSVGGNYSGVNSTAGGGNITAGGSNSASNNNSAVTGVVTALGSGPDFDLSSVNLSGTTLSNITVNLRAVSATVAGASDAVLLNTGNNALGTVTLTTANAPVTVTTGMHDYNLVQTAALNLPTTTGLTVDAVAGANTPAALQNNTIGTIGGINYNAANNLLNGGQGSRIVLNNPGNTFAGITINNADSANVAASGNLQLGAITVANSMVASSTNGAISQKASAPAVLASALALNAATGIGATNAPVRYDTATAIAAGATPVLATSESGSGRTAVSTTGAVQLGGAINEANFDLTTSNLNGTSGTGTYISPVAVANTATSGEINLLSSGTATLAGDVTTTGNAFIQSVNGNIVQTGGTVSATGAVLTARGGTIGTALSPVQTNVATLGLNVQGEVDAVNAGALTLGALTASNGSVNVSTQDGTLTVGAVNLAPGLAGNAAGLSQSGVSANGSGAVNLAANG
ncbi:beta strand repeat-containing protein, partial [Burkholderia territorii]|uniref:beta strand repeat-containing protein n=1 Tax=Burkholderia territorii TaxID=1503055 RepID=UPI000ADEFDEE